MPSHPPCPACLGSITPLRSAQEDGIIISVTWVAIPGVGYGVSLSETYPSLVPLHGIERRADSMRRRPPCFAIVLVFTLWAFAGLVTLTCGCCVLMGVTCPGVCASSPSELSTPSHDTLGCTCNLPVLLHHLLSKCPHLHRRLSPSPPSVSHILIDNRDVIRPRPTSASLAVWLKSVHAGAEQAGPYGLAGLAALDAP